MLHIAEYERDGLERDKSGIQSCGARSLIQMRSNWRWHILDHGGRYDGHQEQHLKKNTWSLHLLQKSDVSCSLLPLPMVGTLP